MPIGEWVLRTGLPRAAATGRQASGRGQRVAGAVPQRGSRASRVRARSGASRPGAERLELEITEAVLLRDTDADARDAAQLRALGVRIAMDDFGTGLFVA